MKKLLFISGIIMSLFLSACGAAPQTAPQDAKPQAQASANVKKVNLTINNQKATLLLYDNPVANALYAQLPLTLKFSDFNSTEKIAYLPQKIHEGHKPEGHAPKAGDLCLYAPWGNICFFYKDYRHTGDLFSLGRLENGADILRSQNGDFTAALEKAN